MKCKPCGEPAVIDLPRHRAAFCHDCFVHHCHEQVRRAINSHSMMRHRERVLVAISGGKDSLALWHMLVALGHRADGVYLGLGIGDYSDTSRGYAERFAADNGLTLHVVDIPTEHGFAIPEAARATKRVPCSACGLSKRHLLNRAALGYVGEEYPAFEGSPRTVARAQASGQRALSAGGPVRKALSRKYAAGMTPG